MTDERRKNDDLIIYKLDSMSERLDAHIQKTEYVLHGNGKPGLKTTVEVMRSRMMLMWGFMSVTLVAVITDYIKS